MAIKVSKELEYHNSNLKEGNLYYVKLVNDKAQYLALCIEDGESFVLLREITPDAYKDTGLTYMNEEYIEVIGLYDGSVTFENT